MNKFDGLTVEELKTTLKNIDERIKEYERSDRFIEKSLENLIGDRLCLNKKLGQVDELVKSAVRSAKYPPITEYALKSKGTKEIKVVLKLKDMFLSEADTMVSAIHVEKGFESIERTASHEFIKRNGGKLFEQPIELGDKKAGDFVVLEHRELSAPMSHHILYYKDINGKMSADDLDLDILEKGIQTVLADCENRGLKTISFFPLGFEYIFKFPLNKRADNETKDEAKIRNKQYKIRSKVATLLADKIAETIELYFLEQSTSSIKTIYFGFASFITMATLDKAFYKWSAKSKQELYIQNELSRIQNNLFEMNHTNDDKFKETLIDISYALGDKSTILFLGETGVGKTHIAKMLHENSSRKSEKFISQNCAVLRSERAESALFGHIKGSFTDAKKDVEGILKIADGGTLFLDEFGALDLEVQGMLLTFLDDGWFYRLGDYETKITSDAKLIIGTNADIDELIYEHKFRQDLHERVKQWVFTIPPLRERRGDIKILINKFIEDLNEANGYFIELSDDATEKLASDYNWYGNVRQLKSYIEKIYSKNKQQNNTIITVNVIENSPPNNTPPLKGEFGQLEKLLKYYISKWDKGKGKLIRDVLEPIAAKIYIDEKLPVSDSSKFLGLTGSKGENSPLHTKYSEYNEAIKKLENL